MTEQKKKKNPKQKEENRKKNFPNQIDNNTKAAKIHSLGN